MRESLDRSEAEKSLLGKHESVLEPAGVLLCVTGLSPQVVTETLYSVGQNPDRWHIPERVEVITTSVGKAKILETLLAPEGGQFLALLSAWPSLRHVAFDADDLHVVRDPAGRELADITSAQDCTAFADLLAQRINHHCRTDAGPLHVSLAGGRKTMGFYAGYALSLFGRGCDRLSHVLVQPDFEGHPDFYFPTPKPVRLSVVRGRPALDASAAVVTLAEIPFVRMQAGGDPALLGGTISFSAAVHRAQQVVAQPSFRVLMSQQTLELQGQKCPLSLQHLIWAVWLAEDALASGFGVTFDEVGAQSLLGVIDRVVGTGPCAQRDAVESAIREIADGEQPNYFHRARSKFNLRISQKSGLLPQVAKRYEIRSVGERTAKRYVLELPAHAVSMVEGD